MRIVLLLGLATLIALPIVEAEEKQRYAKIPLTSLEDKIRGGWAEQMIGVSLGFPTEFAYLKRIIPEHELLA